MRVDFSRIIGLLIGLLFSISLNAGAAPSIECQYTVMSAPFFHVSIELTENNKIGSKAFVNLHGASKTVEVSIDAPLAGETYRLTLAPDNPGDTLFLVLKNLVSLEENQKLLDARSPKNSWGLSVSATNSGTWLSLLINPGTPYLNEVSGECIWP